MQKIIFHYWKNTKMPKVPSSVQNATWRGHSKSLQIIFFAFLIIALGSCGTLPLLPKWCKNKNPPTVAFNGRLICKGNGRFRCSPLWALARSWALSVFFSFFINKKWFFAFFFQVNLTESGLFKQDWCRNGLFTWQKMQQIIFYYWKNSKIPKVPSSGRL